MLYIIVQYTTFIVHQDLTVFTLT